MSTIRADNLATRDGTYTTSMQNPVRGSAKAWVNFNGTGTVAIRSSYNVTSITDHGVGEYTMNFTNTMADANYAAVGTGNGVVLQTVASPPTTTTFRFATYNGSFVLSDYAQDYVAIFGN
jgi:hypothetical protein